MFSEQYRRDNELLSAKETLLMGIQNQIQEEERHANSRARFVRYGIVAAAVVLVLAGALGFLLNRPGAGKSSLENTAASAAGENAATIADASLGTAAAPEAAVLEAIAEAVEDTAPAAEGTASAPAQKPAASGAGAKTLSELGSVAALGSMGGGSTGMMGPSLLSAGNVGSQSPVSGRATKAYY